MDALFPGSMRAEFIMASVDLIVRFHPIVISYLWEGISGKGRDRGFCQTGRIKGDWMGPVCSGAF